MRKLCLLSLLLLSLGFMSYIQPIHGVATVTEWTWSSQLTPGTNETWIQVSSDTTTNGTLIYTEIIGDLPGLNLISVPLPNYDLYFQFLRTNPDGSKITTSSNGLVAYWPAYITYSNASTFNAFEMANSGDFTFVPNTYTSTNINTGVFTGSLPYNGGTYTQEYNVSTGKLISESVSGASSGNYQIYVLNETLSQPNPSDNGNYVAIYSDADFTSYNFAGSGTAGEPYIIENRDISVSSGTGIIIAHTNSYFTIRNNVIDGLSSARYGIHILDANNGLIENNKVKNIAGDGIRVQNSDGVNVTNNEITQVFEAIQVYFSIDVLVNLNNAHSNYGTLIDVVNSTSVGVVDNNLDSGDYGISFANSSVSDVKANEIYSSFLGGIRVFEDSHFISMEYNVIYQNEGAGIQLDSNTWNVTIDGNDLKDNTVEIKNDGINNTVIRNYYFDYSGEGSYQISGVAQSQDTKPALIPNHFDLVDFVLTFPSYNGVIEGTESLTWSGAVDTFSHDLVYVLEGSRDNWDTSQTLFNTVLSSFNYDTTQLDNGDIQLRFVIQDQHGFYAIVKEGNYTIANPVQSTSSSSLSTQNSSNGGGSFLPISVIPFCLMITSFMVLRRKALK